VLAWIDEVLGVDGSPALETIMADVPKDAARVMVVSRIGPEAQQLAERYVRRGLRAAEKPADEDVAPIAMQYVSVSGSARAPSLRRLLDELDPTRAVVWVRSAESAEKRNAHWAISGTRAVRVPCAWCTAAIRATRDW
jgi:superfamily II DNA/RNA helicase